VVTTRSIAGSLIKKLQSACNIITFLELFLITVNSMTIKNRIKQHTVNSILPQKHCSTKSCLIFSNRYMQGYHSRLVHTLFTIPNLILRSYDKKESKWVSNLQTAKIKNGSGHISTHKWWDKSYNNKSGHVEIDHHTVHTTHMDSVRLPHYMTCQHDSAVLCGLQSKVHWLL